MLKTLRKIGLFVDERSPALATRALEKTKNASPLPHQPRIDPLGFEKVVGDAVGKEHSLRVRPQKPLTIEMDQMVGSIGDPDFRLPCDGGMEPGKGFPIRKRRHEDETRPSRGE